MRKEKKNPYNALYSKQRDIQSTLMEGDWACGYSCLITAMRLLGETKVTAQQLVVDHQRLIEKGLVDEEEGTALDGIGDFVPLCRKHKYIAVHKDFWISEQKFFIKYLKELWEKKIPVILGATSDTIFGTTPHWIVAYSDVKNKGVWIMDPMDSRTVFEKLSWKEFIRYVKSYDEEGKYFSTVAIKKRLDRSCAIPPLKEMFEFINMSPGEVMCDKGVTKDDVCGAIVKETTNIISSMKIAYIPNKVEKIYRGLFTLYKKHL